MSSRYLQEKFQSSDDKYDTHGINYNSRPQVNAAPDNSSPNAHHIHPKFDIDPKLEEQVKAERAEHEHQIEAKIAADRTAALALQQKLSQQAEAQRNNIQDDKNTDDLATLKENRAELTEQFGTERARFYGTVGQAFITKMYVMTAIAIISALLFTISIFTGYNIFNEVNSTLSRVCLLLSAVTAIPCLIYFYYPNSDYRNFKVDPSIRLSYLISVVYPIFIIRCIPPLIFGGKLSLGISSIIPMMIQAMIYYGLSMHCYSKLFKRDLTLGKFIPTTGAILLFYFTCLQDLATYNGLSGFANVFMFIIRLVASVVIEITTANNAVNDKYNI